MTDAAAPPGRVPSLLATWQRLLTLMKPRVMSLVVFTAVTGLVCARAPIDPVLAAVAVLCITRGSRRSGGAEHGLRFRYRRLDAAHPRPPGPGRPGAARRRPGSGRRSVPFSVGIMALAANCLAAALLAFTIFFYAVVYTAGSSGATPQNIVIGGLAGALPPAVGWAAASGDAPCRPGCCWLIIFLWTPPHFWALSLYTTATTPRPACR